MWSRKGQSPTHEVNYELYSLFQRIPEEPLMPRESDCTPSTMGEEAEDQRGEGSGLRSHSQHMPTAGENLRPHDPQPSAPSVTPGCPFRGHMRRQRWHSAPWLTWGLWKSSNVLQCLLLQAPHSDPLLRHIITRRSRDGDLTPRTQGGCSILTPWKACTCVWG